MNKVHRSLLKKIYIPGTDVALYCDTSTTKARPFITEHYRRKIFDNLHNLSHPGIRGTARLVSHRFVWPKIQRDCRIWARAWPNCQRSKISRHVSTPLGHFGPSSNRFRNIHVDIVGPLPPAHSFRYCLTVIYRFSRRPEVWPLEYITAESVAKGLIACWISRFGIPERITTDQGRQFKSQLYKSLGLHMGIHRSRTTSYHHSNRFLSNPTLPSL